MRKEKVILDSGSAFSVILEQNPGIRENEIYDFFLNDLRQYMDDMFESWCTYDDYSLVTKDFDAEDWSDTDMITL